jgi:hypothetical protein
MQVPGIKRTGNMGKMNIYLLFTNPQLLGNLPRTIFSLAQ